MPTDNTRKINHLLAPFSFLYGLGVRCRNQLFDWGLLPTEQFPVPVLCIGNLTVGGTGKTPHTEYLIRLLQPTYRIAVLSRGYKRKTKGFILADEHSTSWQIGDEPLQMKRKFPMVTVAVDADRRNGIKRLLALPEKERPEVILLDDAFQHRYVTPSFSILLTAYDRLFRWDKLLPVGLLREPISGKRRADVVIVTKCKPDLKPIEYRIIEEDMHLVAHQKVFFTEISYDELIPVFGNHKNRIHLSDIRANDTCVVVSGIASPGSFYDEIRKYPGKVLSIQFPDHHDFSLQDIKKIKTTLDLIKSERKFLIVTEKDAARLVDNKLVPEEWKDNLFYLPIRIKFDLDKGDEFDDMILKHITTFYKNNIYR